MPETASNSEIEFLSREREHSFSDEWYRIATNEHFWLAWRCRVLEVALQDAGLDFAAQLRVLDVGGGCGVVASQLEPRTCWIVDTTDLDREALSRCPAGRGRRLYYDILECRQELRNAYDVVLLMDVLEHISDPTSFARASIGHLRPGGVLAVNVPALEAFRSPYDDAVGHLHRFDRPTLRHALADLSLDRIELRYWGMSMLPLLAARKALLALKRDRSDLVRTGFAPPSQLVNALLHLVGRIETSLLRRPFLGASLMLTARRELL